jgi:hypothetical protein
MDNRDRNDFWNSSNIDDYFNSSGSINTSGQSFHNGNPSIPTHSGSRGDAAGNIASNFGGYLGLSSGKPDSFSSVNVPQPERIAHGLREHQNDYDLDDYNDQYFDEGYDNPPAWADAPLPQAIGTMSQDPRFLASTRDSSFNQYPGSSMPRQDDPQGFPPQTRLNPGHMDYMSSSGNYPGGMPHMTSLIQPPHGHYPREHDMHLGQHPGMSQQVRYKPNIPNPAQPPMSQQHLMYQQHGSQHPMYPPNGPPHQHQVGGHIMSSMGRPGSYGMPPRGVLIPPRPQMNAGPYGRMQPNQGGMGGGQSQSGYPGTGGSNAQGRAINKMLLDVLRSRIVDPNRLALIVDANIERMDCVNLATLLFHTGKKRLLLTPLFIKRIATRFSLLKEELRAREASNALYGLKCMSSDAPEVRQLILALAHKVSLSSSDLVAQAVGNAM